jgi:hypothetical protein
VWFFLLSLVSFLFYVHQKTTTTTTATKIKNRKDKMKTTGAREKEKKIYTSESSLVQKDIFFVRDIQVEKEKKYITYTLIVLIIFFA